MQRIGYLGLASSVAVMAGLVPDGLEALDSLPYVRKRWGGGRATQGSKRRHEHERHRNRLARKARRVERLHRHTAKSRRALIRESAIA